MKIRTISSDGTEHDGEFDLAIHTEDGDPYDPAVIVRIRPLTRAMYRKLERQAEGWIPGERGQGRVMKVNQNTLAGLIVDAVIVSWNAEVRGADGTTLPCTSEFKPHLPAHIQLQIVNAAQTTEETAAAETFRQSAAVV